MLLQNRKTLEIFGHEKTSFRNSRWSVSFEFSAQLARSDPAGEKRLECRRDVLNLVRRFVHEFQPEVANSYLTPWIDVRTCFLRLSAEHRIPAANVGYYRMRTALWISQRDPMLFAGPAAIAISTAGGKNSAEYAMASVEDRKDGDRQELPELAVLLVNSLQSAMDALCKLLIPTLVTP
jgi:hypothetical protein